MEIFANIGNLHSEVTPFESSETFASKSHPSVCKIFLNSITFWFTHLSQTETFQMMPNMYKTV